MIAIWHAGKKGQSQHQHEDLPSDDRRYMEIELAKQSFRPLEFHETSPYQPSHCLRPQPPRGNELFVDLSQAGFFTCTSTYPENAEPCFSTLAGALEVFSMLSMPPCAMVCGMIPLKQLRVPYTKIFSKLSLLMACHQQVQSTSRGGIAT